MEARRSKPFVGVTVFFSIVDIAVTTVLYIRGTEFRSTFLQDVYLYRFGSSMFEIWAFGLLRASILIGAVVGYLRRPNFSALGAKCIKPFITIIIVLMWMYTVTKLLAYSEVESDLKKPWFWSLFGWTHVALLVMYIIWGKLAKFKRKQDKKERNSQQNVINDEERLIDNDSLSTSSHDSESTTSSDSQDSKKDEKKDKENKTPSWKTVLRLLSLSLKDWPVVCTGFTFMLISSGAEIFLPYYTGKVIEGIAIEKSSALFVRAIIIMSCLTVGSSMAAGIRGGCFKTAMAKLQVRINNLLFSTLMKQEVAFYDSTRTGEITSRLTSDTTTMTEALSLNVNIFLRTLVQTVGICVFMFKLSWKLSMVTVIGLPVLTGVSEIYGEYYKNLQKKVQDSLAKVNEVAEEACSSMRTVRSFANESSETKRYADKLNVTYKLKIKEAIAYAGYMWSTDFFALGLIVATLYYGGYLVVHEELSGGKLISFILYQMQLGFCLETLAAVYTGVMQAVGASEKVFELIDREPKIDNDSGKYIPKSLAGKLEFQNVTFYYPTKKEKPALKDVSFSIAPGEIVALVGPSGGGKSTIVNLIEHFYETEKGQVLLDGVPIKEYDHKFLHEKVALVGQEPVLYARSIKENIGYGLDEYTLEDVKQAAKQANAQGFIEELKKNYNSQTGEKGMQLSGGQKQRVAIARALIRNPVVLLLDEATSALDSESEYLVQEAIYQNLKGRAVLIVAHRLSTVEKANRIIVVDNGQIVEQGTNAELLAAGGMFAQLVKRQILNFEPQPPKNNLESQTPTSYGSFKSINSAENLGISPHGMSPYSKSPSSF